MRKQVDLLNGPIFPTLTGLAASDHGHLSGTDGLQSDGYGMGRPCGFPCSGGSGKRPECIHGCLREL